jgi:hypothetical protein
MRAGIVSCIVPRRALQCAEALLAVLLLSSCGDPPPPGNPELSIELRWIEGYKGEDRSEVETGILWTLSFLGASLPRDRDPLSWRGNVVTLALDHAGIDAAALPHWERLLAAMKASEEYRVIGALDVGRFVAMTLCSSNHYYALTGAVARYERAYASRAFVNERVALVESGVSHGDRLLEIAQGPDFADVAFIAHEGTGAIAQDTFVAEEHELLDVMPNGQLRVALYGADGALKPAADRNLTPAGKPSKCLWCHETHLLRPFKGRTSVPGYLPPVALEQRVAAGMQELRSVRSGLDSRIDFAREQDHTYAELLYLSFYEPSADRVAREWGVPAARVMETLSALPTHAHEEFDFLGQRLYHRSDVDRLAPYGVLEPPTDAREPSTYEPDLLR